MKISVFTPTHNPKWLADTWRSLERQTHADFEWILVPNNFEAGASFEPPRDPRVRVFPYFYRNANIGALKAFACARASGDVVLELDHDDLLTPNALAKVVEAFADPAVDFVYSDCVDWSPSGSPVTYHDPERRAAWERDGWRFMTSKVELLPTAPVAPKKRGGKGKPATKDVRMMMHPICFQPSALGVSQIFTAPNHLRAWRRSFYESIGGHDPSFGVCDDAEILIRTYLRGRMKKIPAVLYVYRIEGANTWLGKVDEIAKLTGELQGKNLQALVARECELRGLPCFDLGGALGSPGAPWQVVDLFDGTPGVKIADLRERWPFEDSSVGAFRAADFLEHLPDKVHTMSEIYRCLAPGGWLLSQTPDACGDGAYQDPTHCSTWVPNSFRYYTDRNLAKYIRNTTERFMAARLYRTTGEIPYVVADLVSLKGDDGSLPGHRGI